jgi:[ribosomal protein S5]-alanine N-acetyltransferase
MNDRTFQHFPILHTERLTLRDLRPTDAEALFGNYSDPRVTRQLGIAPHRTLEDTHDFLLDMHAWYRNRQVVRWVLTLRNGDDHLIGTLGFHQFDFGARRAEMGYEMNPTYWGNGYMSEAVAAIMDYGFYRMGLQRIEAGTDGINERSQRLLERLGFKQEGCLRRRAYYPHTGELWDEYWFGMLREEWDAIRKA